MCKVNQKNYTFKLIITAFLMLALVTTSYAQTRNRIELETLTITGNTELPKILYLIPSMARCEAFSQKQPKAKAS